MSKKKQISEHHGQVVAGLEHQKSLLSTINNFAIELLSIPSTTRLVWYVAREVVARLGFDDCVIYLLNPARDQLHQVAAIGVKNPLGDQIVNALEIPVGKGITGRVAASKGPLVIGDLSLEADYIPDVEPALSEICVPLIIDGEVVGVIDCEDPRPSHFGQDHLEILTTVAAMTSGKLKLLEEGRQAEERARDLSRLNAQHEKEIQERKKTEDQLRENQALIDALIEHSPVAVSIKDLEGRYSFVSPTYSRYLGVSAGDAVGRAAEDLLSPETIAVLKVADQAIVASGQPLGLDKAFPIRIDSSILLVTKFPIQDPDGRVISIGTIGIDITEQENTKEALSRNEAYLRALVEANPSSIFLKDLDRRYVVINSAFEDFMRLSREEIVGKTIEELSQFDPQYVDQINRFDEEVLHSGKVIHHEQRPPLPDGRTPTTLLTKFPIFGPDGEPTGIGSMETDISEQKEADEKLRQSEERLRQATHLAKIGYYVWDAVEDRCLICSEEHARLHGLSSQEYIDRAANLDAEFSLTHPEDRVLLKDTMRELRGGKAIEVEYRTITPSGEYHYVREIAEPIFDDANRVVQEIGASQDITALRQAEARLVQAQKMEAVGQLTGGIAHDFNNLLAIILGNAEILEGKVGPEDAVLPVIIRAAERGAQLTNRLLAFSRQTPLVPTSIYLSDLVNSMSELLQRTLGETIEIKFRAAPKLWPALADPSQVENALLNLALNARDAMSGSGRLTIECANTRLDEAFAANNPETKPGDYVMLAVTDNGVGMSAEVQDHAFEPFYTTKGVGEGSGLGLSMVYGFAKQSDGHVTIDSEEGIGTTIKVYLPKADEATRSDKSPLEKALPRGRGEKVLVIEDDPDVRDLAVKMLESINYQVSAFAEAGSAEKAIAGGAAPDILLLDVVLPGGTSGPEFAAKALQSYPEFKIIFMSGYPADSANRGGFLDSDSVLLNKPFQRRQLAKALRDALD